MTATQKSAWFVLIVNVATIGLIASLWPFIGAAAMAGSALLGLLGLQPLFFRKRPGQVVADERDALIWRRSTIFAYSIFWVLFVLAAVWMSALIYGWDGAVPVTVVQFSVFVAFIVFMTLWSLAVLLQYGKEPRHAG